MNFWKRLVGTKDVRRPANQVESDNPAISGEGAESVISYTLDGQYYPPDCLGKRRYADVLKNSGVPLEDWQGRLIHRNDPKVIYQFVNNALAEIIVNADYATDFLGLKTGHPEYTLQKLGYRPIGKHDAGSKWWFYWTKDNWKPSSPVEIHYVVVSRDFNDDLMELMFTRGTITQSLEPVSVARHPITAKEHYNRGEQYDKNNDFVRAIEAYSEAILLDPNLAEAYFARGFMYQATGAFDMAIRDFSQAISFAPKNSGAYLARGFVFQEKGDLDRAIQDYTEAVSLGPEESAYLNRGAIYLKSGAIESAIRDFSQAIAINSAYAAAYKNRAIAYRELGKDELALLDEKKAKELSEQNLK